MITDIKYSQIKHGLLHGLLTRDRFRLTERLVVRTKITGYEIRYGRILLHKDGLLEILPGYIWDGASGPTWDTEVTMAASAVHDAFYRLMANEKLPLKERWKADAELWYLMRVNGAWWFRAAYYYTSVQLFGKSHI